MVWYLSLYYILITYKKQVKFYFKGHSSMAHISIFGKGNMAQALKSLYEEAGNSVTLIGHESGLQLGEVVILAVPYTAIDDIINKYSKDLQGKIIIDITNPLDFSTFDRLVTPEGSSAAEEIAKKIPAAIVLKAFNTNFANSLLTKTVANKQKITVFMASDNQKAKETFKENLKEVDITIVDAGSLKRARELERLGFLQLTLAIQEKISFTGGFVLYK